MAAPPPFRQIGAGQVELRAGGGWKALWGLPFFLYGLLTTLIGLGILPAQDPSTSSRLVFLLMGLVFMVVGGVLPFGNRRIVFDADQRSVIRCWSLILPLRRVERSLSDFSAVLLALDSNSDSADTYPVRLKAKTGRNLTLCSSAQFGEARGQAEFLARFLHLDLEDRSTDHDLILSPERAGRTLQERLRSGDLKPEGVTRPAVMRSEVDESGAQVRLVIPGRRWASITLVVGAAVALVVPLSLTPTFARALASPDTGQVVLLGCLMFAFSLPLLWVIYSVLTAALSKTVVVASRTGILIERKGVWRTRETLVPAGDILALDYSTMESLLDSTAQSVQRNRAEAQRPPFHFSYRAPGSRLLAVLKTFGPSRGMIVKSRHGLFLFGEGLSGEELQYLWFIITRALAHF